MRHINPSEDAAPWFYDYLRGDGFVEDVPWNAADFDTRRRVLALEAHLATEGVEPVEADGD